MAQKKIPFTDEQKVLFDALKRVGASADERISTQDKKILFALAEGIIRMENSNQQPYSEATFEKAFALL
ncbi:hypothetical protein [Xenorhabdus kozodoii]|uniref:Structural protein n=1 Tax=Xenorhabdus kozodoii TaxID=351676 RepID=A0A2D0LIL7_9GAMM|nr:hypothetical protein [Xenorhabdus kozodoii]PHM75107.1 structural protein [Xenorhabdus kozodoii]